MNAENHRRESVLVNGNLAEAELFAPPERHSPRLDHWMDRNLVATWQEDDMIEGRPVWVAAGPYRGRRIKSYGPSEEAALRALAKKTRIAAWDEEVAA